MIIPKKGDVVLVDLFPTIGHEQSGLRPAVVLSDYIFNEKMGLAFICPITSTIRGHAFEVEVATPKTKGVILTQQSLTIDFVARKTKIVDQVSTSVVREAIDKVKIILG